MIVEDLSLQPSEASLTASSKQSIRYAGFNAGFKFELSLWGKVCHFERPQFCSVNNETMKHFSSANPLVNH